MMAKNILQKWLIMMKYSSKMVKTDQNSSTINNEFAQKKRKIIKKVLQKDNKKEVMTDTGSFANF